MVDNAREHVWIGLFSCRRFREQYICFGIHTHTAKQCTYLETHYREKIKLSRFWSCFFIV